MMKKITENAIKVKELVIHFHNHLVLNDINLNFQRNQIHVLVGRSGSGKTTFLRSLNRLNEEFSGCTTQGHIEINLGNGLQIIQEGKNQPLIDLQMLRSKVGMLFQTPQLLPVSIYKNILMPLELVARCSSKQAKEKAAYTLQMVGLWDEIKDRLNLPAERLSGGQQQRLCLARTLALDPTILLLDEPTSSLDIVATQQIEALLLKLKERYTIIMVSHNIEQAKRLANSLSVFEQGHLTQSYSNIEHLSHEDIAQWF